MLSQDLRLVFAALLALVYTISAGPVHPPQKRILEYGRLHNDFNCKPTPKHPNPLILVHGIASSSDAWSDMTPLFKSRGYCVFGLDYGHVIELTPLGGMADMYASAKELSRFVDKVLKTTGATKVDIVGHSEGSVLPRLYFKYLDGVAKTGSFAAIASVQYGTTLDGIASILKATGLLDLPQGLLSPLCMACFQLIKGSSLLNDLNRGSDTYPEVKYLMLVSKFDEFVTPYTSGFLKTAGPNVFNVKLQSLCPRDFSGHLEQLHDHVVFHAVDSFLSRGKIINVGC